MTDLLNNCPRCGHPFGHCTHTTQGEITTERWPVDPKCPQPSTPLKMDVDYSGMRLFAYVIPNRPQSADTAIVASPVLAAAGLAGFECHGLDTPERVFFYEQDFYVLSNFSAFEIERRHVTFATSEHLYHWEKFRGNADLRFQIRTATSAHQAFKIAEANKHQVRSDWLDVRVDIMRDILRDKAIQHEYVRRKLLATGDRELVENSWRDSFWGWGPNRDGQNMLGKLWMEIRAELRSGAAS